MHEEEEDRGTPITKEAIVKLCLKHNLYTVPDLNDVLYLNNQGFSRIAGLDEYINVKCLWLNNNAINKIENISHLTNLMCLYLQENFLESMNGIGCLPNLETLILSSNYISSIEDLAEATALTSLEMDNNKIRAADGLKGLLECKQLQSLNLSHNEIKGEDVIDVISQLTELRVLKLDGNPICREIKNYRRKFINVLPNLRFFDDQPVTDYDRRLAKAWIEGGRKAEIDERHKIAAEEDDVHRAGMRDFRRLQRDALTESGKNLKDFPELMSSDDEEVATLMKMKFESQKDDDEVLEVTQNPEISITNVDVDDNTFLTSATSLQTQIFHDEKAKDMESLD